MVRRREEGGETGLWIAYEFHLVEMAFDERMVKAVMTIEVVIGELSNI